MNKFVINSNRTEFESKFNNYVENIVQDSIILMEEMFRYSNFSMHSPYYSELIKPLYESLLNSSNNISNESIEIMLSCRSAVFREMRSLKRELKLLSEDENMNEAFKDIKIRILHKKIKNLKLATECTQGLYRLDY